MGIRKSQVEKVLKASNEDDDARTRAERARAQAVFGRACQNASPEEREEVWQDLLKKWS